uniref:Kringle domain-containing protein n=1 Tax=Globodera pallida TaxID=36090 RepID=A0A183C3N0_GLOPA
MRFCSIVIYYCAVAAALRFVVDAKFDFGQFEGPDHRDPKCYNESTDKNYFGIQSKSVDGRPCYRWIDAINWMKGNLSRFQIHYFADEYNDHNHCRNFRLDTYRSYALLDGLTKATVHPFLHYDDDEWMLGPWCYVQRTRDLKEVSSIWKTMFSGGYFLKAPAKNIKLMWEDQRPNDEKTKEQANDAIVHLKIEPKHCFKPCTTK